MGYRLRETFGSGAGGIFSIFIGEKCRFVLTFDGGYGIIFLYKWQRISLSGRTARCRF